MTDKPKNPQEAKIKKGLPPRRDIQSVQLVQTVTIPLGTILRAIGDDKYACSVGFGGITGEFSITVKDGAVLPASAGKRVIAS